MAAVFLVLSFTSWAHTAGIDEFTKLIIHSDNTHGSTDIQDSSSAPHPIILHGDVHHSTDQAKFGNTSLLFDGNGDYLEIPNHADWCFGGEDFTIDFWIFPNTFSEQAFIGEFGRNPPGQHSGDDSISWAIENNYPGPMTGTCFYGRKQDFSLYAYYTDTPNFSLEWKHIAIVRVGNTLKIFENGQEVLSEPMDFQIRSNLTYPVKVGSVTTNDVYYYLDGYIDEFRISKGIARWTEDFTPPTEPYTAEPLPPPDYVLEDSNGFIWELREIKRDLRGIYLTGTCDTGSALKTVRGLYKWNGTFALNADGGAVPDFTYLVKWRRKGQWIDSSGNVGNVRIQLSAEDTSAATDWEKDR